MLLSRITASAYDIEAGSIYYNITNRSELTVEVTYKEDIGWGTYSPYNGNVVIPTTVTYDNVEYNVTSIGKSAFWGCSGLISITIPEGVTSIGKGTFGGCSSLVSITIPEGVTSIGSYAFEGCSNLTAITLPESVNSIGEEAFHSTAWYRNQPDGIVCIGKKLYGYKRKMPINTTITIP